MSVVWQTPSVPWELCSPDRKAKLRKVWEAGNLRWKLDPSQQAMYDQIKASWPLAKSAIERSFCLDVSRQSGKDFMMSVMAVEHCIQNKRMLRIPYGCPTVDNVQDLLAPTMASIFQDCPPDMLPKEIRNNSFFNSRPYLTWPWGARIVLVGCDLHPDWLRGPASEVFILTEPAFMEGLDSLLESILFPQQLTMPHGWSILASTPPETPGHAWTQKYLPRAKDKGMYAKRTIYDCPRFTPEQVEGYRKQYGEKSTRWRREYLCEHIVESEQAVVPEFSDVKADIVHSNYKIPAYRDTYVALDPGFSHATGGVFAFYDFETDKVIIEGDLALKGLNSREVSRAVKAREWQLWGYKPEKPGAMNDETWVEEVRLMQLMFYRDLPVAQPTQSWRDGQLKYKVYRRVSDTDSRLICDMSLEHGLTISPTEKDEAIAALNAMRIRIADKKIIINPRCTWLISHLEQAVWNKGRTKFAEESGGGHFDTIPALVYLNRNMIWGKNPNPPTTVSRATHFVPPGTNKSGKTATALSRIFGKR